MAETLLEMRNIETFYGPIMALRGVSLEVPEGSIVTVLGANGAGKTTILKTISGILRPRKGSVLFQGRQIQTRMPDWYMWLRQWRLRPVESIVPERVIRAINRAINGMLLRESEPDWVARRGIAHVPESREIFPFLTVRENLMMGAFTRVDRAGLHEDIEVVYNYFPILKERADQRAAYLSGGQQQMLVIARGLMARPKLMLLDEPSLGLSPLLVQEIFGIIRRLNEERKVTMLLVEQNANMALKVAHHGYVLELGRIVMNDSCERLRESEDVKEFFLGMKEEGARGQRRWKRKKTWR